MPHALREMPPEARALRLPWPSLVGQVPGLTPDLERCFRAGQRVSRLRAGFMLGGSMKGGSSSVWTPVGEVEWRAYEGWAAREGFPERAAPGALERLEALCRGASIRLALSSAKGSGGAFGGEPALGLSLEPACASLAALLDALPRAHLARRELSTLELGGWGQDSAKASGYRDGVVHLYDFALRGARRTFVALALHELGHAQERAFPERARPRLAHAHAVLGRSSAFYPIEFLLSPESRVSYQRMAFGEFLAETYLAYTACGSGLRRFILGLGHAERDAWLAVYALFREAFEGAEYA